MNLYNYSLSGVIEVSLFFPVPIHTSPVLSNVGYALLLNILLPNSIFSADGKNKTEINISDTNEIETIAVVDRASTKALVSSGINVRQSGGIGSEFNCSLNRLLENQIRYFIDGIPMKYFGSALTFPVNLVE